MGCATREAVVSSRSALSHAIVCRTSFELCGEAPHTRMWRMPISTALHDPACVGWARSRLLRFKSSRIECTHLCLRLLRRVSGGSCSNCSGLPILCSFPSNCPLDVGSRVSGDVDHLLLRASPLVSARRLCVFADKRPESPSSANDDVSPSVSRSEAQQGTNAVQSDHPTGQYLPRARGAGVNHRQTSFAAPAGHVASSEYIQIFGLGASLRGPSASTDTPSPIPSNGAHSCRYLRVRLEPVSLCRPVRKR